MMSSAQREVAGEDEAGEEFRLVVTPTELRQEVAARLAAHRRRRGAVPPGGADAAPRAQRGGRQNAIAAAVAERYAHTPSYRAILAEQARHAAEEAAARAEVAHRNAQAAAALQQELLGELELWGGAEESSEGSGEVFEVTGTVSPVSPGLRSGDQDAVTVGGLTVRLYEDLGAPVRNPVRLGGRQSAPDAEESRALDAEIAFRKAPVFEEYKAPWNGGTEAPVPLPANLLEFPRQLVAARKARPRLAEGPLRDEASSGSQLRIFEVEPEQISTAPAAPAGSEWSTSIRLDAQTPGPVTASDAAPLLPSLAPPQTAPLALRTMAAMADLGLVLGALVAFVAVFAEVSGQVPSGVPAGVALVGIAAALMLLYQLLFFSLSDGTPGMRYARIGLCTLCDENPTRAAMRRRIAAGIVALCPLGLGLLWTLLDDDGLGWHDRLSRMYPRAY